MQTIADTRYAAIFGNQDARYVDVLDVNVNDVQASASASTDPPVVVTPPAAPVKPAVPSKPLTRDDQIAHDTRVLELKDARDRLTERERTIKQSMQDAAWTVGKAELGELAGEDVMAAQASHTQAREALVVVQAELRANQAALAVLGEVVRPSPRVRVGAGP